MPPQLIIEQERGRLIVNGQPLLILGGELFNSSISSPEDITTAFTQGSSAGRNTLLAAGEYLLTGANLMCSVSNPPLRSCKADFLWVHEVRCIEGSLSPMRSLNGDDTWNYTLALGDNSGQCISSFTPTDLSNSRTNQIFASI